MTFERHCARRTEIKPFRPIPKIDEVTKNDITVVPKAHL